MPFKLICRAFAHEDAIPQKYSRKGGNLSPPLAWTDAPEGTKSFALIVDDPDAPSGNFVHWLVYRIPAATRQLDEHQPPLPMLPDGSRQGRNGFGDIGYGGPQPPSGVHRYFFRLYALDNELSLPPGASRQDLDEAIRGHVLSETDLMGRYGHR